MAAAGKQIADASSAGTKQSYTRSGTTPHTYTRGCSAAPPAAQSQVQTEHFIHIQQDPSHEDQGVVQRHRQLDVPKVAGALVGGQAARGAPAGQQKTQKSTTANQQRRQKGHPSNQALEKGGEAARGATAWAAQQRPEQALGWQLAAGSTAVVPLQLLAGQAAVSACARQPNDTM